MTEERKEQYRKRGAIVVFTCADGQGMAHLLYLKDLGDGSYSLIRDDIFNNEETIVGGPWQTPSAIKASLLINTISNKFRMSAVSCKRTYIQPFKDYQVRIEAQEAIEVEVVESGS